MKTLHILHNKLIITVSVSSAFLLLVSPLRAAVPDAAPQCLAVAAGDHEQYRLPSIAHPAAGLSSQIDWGQIPATGGWYGAQVMDSCRYHADGFQTWHGKAAARVEVQPGDDPLNLGEGTERSEMAFLQDSTGKQINETSTSGSVYYATSYFFPATWDGTFIRGNSNSWSFVLQFYGWQGFAAGRGYDADPAAQKYWFGGISARFSDGGNIIKGKWTDFVFMVNWGTRRLTVWRRDEGQTAFTQVLDTTGPAFSGSIYMKQGLYRGGDVGGRTDVLWVGPTARGPTFSAVEMAAFGTGNGNPVRIPVRESRGMVNENVSVAYDHRTGYFRFAAKEPLTIGIFSPGRKLLKSLDMMTAGTVVWDGTDGKCVPVPAGICFFKAMGTKGTGVIKAFKLF
jgi:hypothetical protein